MIMMALIWFGMCRQAINVSLLLRAGDWSGVVLGGLSLGLIYAALDQGNRLDWLNSGVIVGLLASGGLLLAAFVLNEMIIERPLIDGGQRHQHDLWQRDPVQHLVILLFLKPPPPNPLTPPRAMAPRQGS
jgi:MFS transporter, DHA2 family, multidrug resistance protein